jgi:hypothetical protein
MQQQVHLLLLLLLLQLLLLLLHCLRVLLLLCLLLQVPVGQRQPLEDQLAQAQHPRPLLMHQRLVHLTAGAQQLLPPHVTLQALAMHREPLLHHRTLLLLQQLLLARTVRLAACLLH